MSGTITTLPDLSKLFKKLKLIEDIERKLIYEDSIIALSIRNAINTDPTSTNGILSMLKDMATDNRKMMEEIIGIDITKEILSL